MKFNGIIIKKINILHQTLEELESIKNINLKEISENYFLKKGIERSLQICCEAVIDIAHRIISIKKEKPAESASTALDMLVKLGVIKESSTYKKMIQFRNFIVHRYESIDNEILLSILKKNLKDFTNFAMEIETYEN